MFTPLVTASRLRRGAVEDVVQDFVAALLASGEFCPVGFVTKRLGFRYPGTDQQMTGE